MIDIGDLVEYVNRRGEAKAGFVVGRKHTLYQIEPLGEDGRRRVRHMSDIKKIPIPGEDIHEGDAVEVDIYCDADRAAKYGYPAGWSVQPGVVTHRRRGLTPIPEYCWTVQHGAGHIGYFYQRSIRKVTE